MKLKFSFTQFQKNKGFTMMEVIVAIFILEMVMVGGYSLIQQITTGASLNQNKLTASYLVQEKFELVRNTRDNNWLQRENWTEGIVDGIEEIDNFTRTTTIEDTEDNLLKIEVDVSWGSSGKIYNVKAVNHLYNWYEN